MVFAFEKNFIMKRNRNINAYDINEIDLILMLSEGAVLIDVRSPQEYNEGHIDGAILIPEYDIKKKANKLLQDKKRKIIVYCSTGKRSKKAQEELTKMGYMKVYNLYNGYQNY